MIMLALLFGCVGCSSCTPSIPLDDQSRNDDNQNSTDSAKDSASDSAIVDTAPIPPCPVMEEEPNGDYDRAQLVPMEQWICGDFYESSEAAADLDVFAFQAIEDGWVKAWARGQDLGSSADLMLTLKQDNEVALSSFHLSSTDPMLVVPISADSVAYVAIQEQFNDFGDNQFYEALFTAIKPPVEYNGVEEENEESAAEDNNGLYRAQSVEGQDRIFGSISSNFDRDWYSIELEEDERLEINFDANTLGSPVDLVVSLYAPATFDDPTLDAVKVRNNGLLGNSYDPRLVHTADEAGTWGILVESYTSTGSELYWYVMDVATE